MYSFVSRSFVAALSIGLLVLLSAFFTSDDYMMGGGEQIFGDHFRAAEIDAAGNVLKQADGTPSYIDFSSYTVWYKAKLGTATLYFKTDYWDTTAKIYNFQAEIEDTTVTPPIHKFAFGLMTVEHNIATLFIPSEADQDLLPIMRRQGVQFEDSGKDAKFTHRYQVRDGLGVFTGRMRFAQKLRFLIATSNADMDRLAASTAAAHDVSKSFLNGRVVPETAKNSAVNENPGFAFDDQEFSKGFLLKSVYEGTGTSQVIGEQPTYWYSLIDAIYNDKDCSFLVDDDVHSVFLRLAQDSEMKRMLNTVTEIDRKTPPGDWGADVRSVLDSLIGHNVGAVLAVQRGHNDAWRIHEKIGCQGPVVKQFFGNLRSLVLQLLH